MEIALVHHIKYSKGMKSMDFENNKSVIEGFEPWYCKELIKKMKLNIKPNNPNLDGFVNLLFKDDERLSKNKFVHKILNSLDLNWILHPEEIMERTIRFDIYYEEQM